MAGFDDLPFDDAPTAQETFNHQHLTTTPLVGFNF